MSIFIDPEIPASSSVPESGTIVIESDGTSRFIDALCCITNVPFLPSTDPVSFSIATYDALPFTDVIAASISTVLVASSAP